MKKQGSFKKNQYIVMSRIKRTNALHPRTPQRFVKHAKNDVNINQVASSAPEYVLSLGVIEIRAWQS